MLGSSSTSPVGALLLYLAWLVTAFVVRPLIVRARTGDAGFRRLSGRPGSPAWWGGVLFVVAVLAGLGAPIAALSGLPALPGLGGSGVGWLGLLVAVLGWAGTVAAQAAMGGSWRVGVDVREHTGLVTGRAFRLVRHPFFTCAFVTATGLALMAPNVIALAALALLLTAVEIQVRAVEEPHLAAEHGAAYRTYAARTGRFLPGLGRLAGAGPSTAAARDGARHA